MQVRWPNPMQSLSSVLFMDGEETHGTGMPALIRSIPSWDADKRGTDPAVIVVVVLLDGTCPLQYFSFSTQVVSAGLSIEMLKGP
jgi:hypothetical protein